MVNRAKKVEKKYVEQKMKEPMSRNEVYTTFQAMLDDFKTGYLKQNGFMLAQAVHFLNVMIRLLVNKKIITQEEFDSLSEELGEQEKADFEKRKSEMSNKDGKKEKNKKSNRTK